MIFNSFQFIWLFPLIFLAYYGVCRLVGARQHGRIANLILLIISYGLYIQWRPSYCLILFYVTAVTYFVALLIEDRRTGSNVTSLVTIGFFAGLAPLLIFKFHEALGHSVLTLLSVINITDAPHIAKWVAPMGLSFYSLQAVGYVYDVYKQKVKAERNFANYMLFVAFFPQILCGPISKASSLLPQIGSRREFDYSMAVSGCKDLLWGMFLKIVMADRIGLIIDDVFNNPISHGGGSSMLGAALYMIQLYGDFAGYSLMAVGVGKLLGFDLVVNFRRPFFAGSVTDFWRRWHISLTRWLTDYIYIPLGGSRCSKARNYINILIVFIVSGFWHGIGVAFLVWGLLHGIAQVVEKSLGMQKCSPGWWKPFRIAITFIYVSLVFVFFRCESVRVGCHIIAKMVTDPLGYDIIAPVSYIVFASFAIFIVFLREWCNEYRPQWSIMGSRHLAVRWGAYVTLLSIIIMAGVLDSSSFIYGNF